MVYDRTGRYKRDFAGVDASADMDPNVIPTSAFTIDDNHDAIDAISEKGARCAVWFRGEEQFRGIVHDLRGSGPRGRVTANIRGDLRKLWHWHGRPVPTAEVTAQTVEYATYSGTSEENFKAALEANLVRLGVPWTVEPSRGLGKPTTAQLRFHPLADKLLPALTEHNLMVVLTYDDAYRVHVDVRESKLLLGVLTHESGISDSYTYERVEPTATRVIVGGRKEGVEREFAEVRDPALEADWGDVIESFQDARNLEEGSDLSAEGRETLAAAGITSGVSSVLAETDAFRFLKTYRVGDRVRVQVGPVDREQQIGVGITETAEEGVRVTPRIGEISESTNAVLAAQIARLAKTQRDAGRR